MPCIMISRLVLMPNPFIACHRLSLGSITVPSWSLHSRHATLGCKAQPNWEASRPSQPRETRTWRRYPGRGAFQCKSHIPLPDPWLILSAELGQVTDARATMAVFRIHRKEWEKGFRPLGAGASKKRKRSESDTQEDLTLPGEGKKGVSSGLSTIVKRTPQTRTKAAVKAPSSSWWTTLETSTTRKGSMKL